MWSIDHTPRATVVVMPSHECRTDDESLRAVIARALQGRRDVSPSELVELLGEHVIWGPAESSPEPEPAPPRVPMFAA
jgi:hypothetical protein